VVIAGIDEAGLGPVLGPLVVSASAVAVPDELADESLWSLLAPAVARRSGRRRLAVAIDDSKKLYSRRRKAPLAALERGVLSMLAARGRTPSGLRQLLGILAPGSVEPAREYPWYAGLELPLPRAVSDTDVLLAGNALATAMAQRNLRLVTIRSEVVLAGELNRLVTATRNKSTMLLDVTLRLLMHLCRRKDTPHARIYVDRQGGRRRYLSALQRVFSGCEFKILDESESVSAYRLTSRHRCVEIHFCVRGEDLRLPTALSSMVSKYVRELFMAMLNRFWCRYVPGLAPTAGYYIDGRRFFRQIQPAMQKLNVDRRLLYRIR